MGTGNKRITSFGQNSIEAFLDYGCREICIDKQLKATSLSEV